MSEPERDLDMTEPAVAPAVVRPAKDPMKSFRAVMSGTLIMEAIAVALALPIVAKFSGGADSVGGWLIIAIAVILVLCCGVIKRPWAVPLILVLQVALLAVGISGTTSLAVAVMGLLFLALWLWLLWLRRDVARRMAAGRLPSQMAEKASPTESLSS